MTTSFSLFYIKDIGKEILSKRIDSCPRT